MVDRKHLKLISRVSNITSNGRVAHFKINYSRHINSIVCEGISIHPDDRKLWKVSIHYKNGIIKYTPYNHPSLSKSISYAFNLLNGKSYGDWFTQFPGKTYYQANFISPTG